MHKRRDFRAEKKYESEAEKVPESTGLPQDVMSAQLKQTIHPEMYDGIKLRAHSITVKRKYLNISKLLYISLQFLEIPLCLHTNPYKSQTGTPRSHRSNLVISK